MSTRFSHIGDVTTADEEAEALLQGVLDASLAAGELSEAGTETGTDTGSPPPTKKRSGGVERVAELKKGKKKKKSQSGSKTAKNIQ